MASASAYAIAAWMDDDRDRVAEPVVVLGDGFERSGALQQRGTDAAVLLGVEAVHPLLRDAAGHRSRCSRSGPITRRPSSITSGTRPSRSSRISLQPLPGDHDGGEAQPESLFQLRRPADEVGENLALSGSMGDRDEQVEVTPWRFLAPRRTTEDPGTQDSVTRGLFRQRRAKPAEYLIQPLALGSVQRDQTTLNDLIRAIDLVQILVRRRSPRDDSEGGQLVERPRCRHPADAGQPRSLAAGEWPRGGEQRAQQPHLAAGGEHRIQRVEKLAHNGEMMDH
jgi:hypothetical protein